MEKPRRSNTTTGSDKFIVRLPDGMRDRIAAAARENNRTMNAEVVARLEASFAGWGDASRDALAEAVQRIEQDLKVMKRRPDVPVVVRGEPVLLRWHEESQQYRAEPAGADLTPWSDLVGFLEEIRKPDEKPLHAPPGRRRPPREPKKLHSR